MSPSFRHLVPLVLLALLVPVIGSQAWFWSVASDRLVERQLVDRARAMGGPLAVAVEATLRGGGTTQIRARLAAGAADQDFVDALVVDADGAVLAASDPSINGGTLPDVGAGSLSEVVTEAVVSEEIRFERQHDQLSVVFPVRMPARDGGFFAQETAALILRFDTRRVSNEIRREALTQFVIGAGIFLFGVFGFWVWFQDAMLSRVHRVVDGLDRLRRGELQERMAMTGGDEISVIARAVDEMAESLEASTRDLERSGVELRELLDERGRLLERVRELSHRLSRTTENERRRIARDLHDDLGQDVNAVRYLLALLRPEAEADEDGQLRETVDKLNQISRGMIEKIRRMLVMLRPAGLDELGLTSALESVAEHLQPLTTAPIVVDGDARRLHPVIETELFRIGQEAVNNAVKHSDARRIHVRFRATETDYTLEIEDDGIGLDPAATGGSPGNARWGLIGMRERARRLGARMELVSAPGRGTVVRVHGRDQEHVAESLDSLAAED